MFKSLLAVAAVGSVATPAAFAGPYFNTEVQNGYVGSDYIGRTIDIHLGYEGSTEKVDYYIQGGPSVVAVEGVDGTETELSGKVGGTYNVSSNVGIYGEISGISNGDSDNVYQNKLGLKYSF
tara:strand:- start:82 stop:447 length:366 start_codon:yes stop_codon:yes gene_type:complete